MLTAYNLQVVTKLEKDTEVSPTHSPNSSPNTSPSISPILSPTEQQKLCSEVSLTAKSMAAVPTIPTPIKNTSVVTEKDQFNKKEVFDISCHEIRNFLFGISGMANLLLKSNISYEAILETEKGKSIAANFRKELLEAIATLRTQVNLLNTLAAQQQGIVNSILKSPRSLQVKTLSTVAPLEHKKDEENAAIILKAKLGIHKIVDELKHASAKLEALLNSAEGQQLEATSRKEILSLIESDKRNIYILDICVEDQNELVEGLGISNSSQAKKNSFLIQPKKIIGEVADILKDKLEEKKLKLELNLATDDIIVEANPANLRRILINIISNAIKFTATTKSKQGIIKVNLANPMVNSNQATLTFSIEDNGIGIKKEEQEGIFLPYQQANSHIGKTYGGTGLGLSCIKKLIESMGGGIKCDSTENVGSKFSFSIKCPLTVNLPRRPSSPLIFSTPVPITKGKHVLIAEDNVINRKLLQNFLLKAGCSFDVAKNGKEAVELCESSKFDVILMDTNMPEMSGIEAAQIIRQSKLIEAAGNKGVPIISLSGNNESTDLNSAIEAGMNDYIIKGADLNLSVLIEKINRLCAKSTNVQSLQNLKL